MQFLSRPFLEPPFNQNICLLNSTVNGSSTVESAKKRNELAIKLRDDYWNLDPYLRARSFYDRVGLSTFLLLPHIPAANRSSVQPGGKLQFYPEKKAEPAPAATPVAANPAPATSTDDLD